MFELPYHLSNNISVCTILSVFYLRATLDAWGGDSPVPFHCVPSSSVRNCISLASSVYSHLLVHQSRCHVLIQRSEMRGGSGFLYVVPHCSSRWSQFPFSKSQMKEYLPLGQAVKPSVSR